MVVVDLWGVAPAVATFRAAIVMAVSVKVYRLVVQLARPETCDAVPSVAADAEKLTSANGSVLLLTAKTHAAMVSLLAVHPKRVRSVELSQHVLDVVACFALFMENVTAQVPKVLNRADAEAALALADLAEPQLPAALAHAKTT